MPVDLQFEPVHTLYVSGQLALPPLTAIATFDDYRGRHPTLRADAFELQFAGGAPADAPLPVGGRQVRGHLSPVGRLVRTAVEIEVVPWSSSRSELAIRPVGRAVSLQPGRRRDRYFDAARAVVDALVAAVERHQAFDWCSPPRHAPESSVRSAVAHARETTVVHGSARSPARLVPLVHDGGRRRSSGR